MSESFESFVKKALNHSAILYLILLAILYLKQTVNYSILLVLM